MPPTDKFNLTAAEFRLVAFNETHKWYGLPEDCEVVYGIYLFLVGEMTFCASLSPSSWCRFIENVFVGLDYDHPFVQDAIYEGGDNYFPFVDVFRPGHPISASFFIPLDNEIALDAALHAAWNDAVEHAVSNSPYVPI